MTGWAGILPGMRDEDTWRSARIRVNSCALVVQTPIPPDPKPLMNTNGRQCPRLRVSGVFLGSHKIWVHPGVLC